MTPNRAVLISLMNMGLGGTIAAIWLPHAEASSVAGAAMTVFGVALVMLRRLEASECCKQMPDVARELHDGLLDGSVEPKD